MYSFLLLLHSWLRWVVLLLALLVLVRAIIGRSSRRPWTAAENRGLLMFTIALDIQVLVGLILYVGISPVTSIAFQNLGAAMRNPSLRFFIVEHSVGMLVAVALAHVARVKVRKAADAASKHRLALLFVALALVAMVLSIPWPGMPAGRPMLRLP